MKMATFLSTKDGLYGSAISGIHVTFIRMTVYCSEEFVTNTLPVTYSSYLSVRGVTNIKLGRSVLDT
jgi:hypothetical protein